MKNLVLTLAVTVLLAACSSGTTVADLPQNVTSQFTGTFQSLNNAQSGTIILDLVEPPTADGAGAVTGNLIIQSSGALCLANGTLEGTSTGFNLSLTSSQTRAGGFIVTTTTTSASGSNTVTVEMVASGVEGTVTSDDGNGNVTTVETAAADELSGDITFQLAISNGGDTLSGTYTVDGDLCSNATGTGNLTVNR